MYQTIVVSKKKYTLKYGEKLGGGLASLNREDRYSEVYLYFQTIFLVLKGDKEVNLEKTCIAIHDIINMYRYAFYRHVI